MIKQELLGTAQDSLIPNDVRFAYDLTSQRIKAQPIDYLQPHDVELVASDADRADYYLIA
jgi:hypothetical protein